MKKGKFLIFKCNWISSLWKIKDFWREFSRTDAYFPQMKNMHLFPRKLGNNSKAVTQTRCVLCGFFFFLPTDGSYFYPNQGKKATVEVSKWGNEVHSYQWNLNGLLDKIVLYKSVQLYLKSHAKVFLIKMLPFSLHAFI